MKQEVDFDKVTNFPLYWPSSQKRTADRDRRRAVFAKRRTGFSSSTKHSIAESTRLLDAELRRMGARDMIISSNLKVKPNGMPYSSQRPPEDPGVALWFTWKKKPFGLGCDKWNTIEDNLWAIVLHIGSIRGQERWGVGSQEQAFAGYAQLPDPDTREWWEDLHVKPDASDQQIKEAYINLARKYHPDAGEGSDPAMFDRVTKAYKLAMAGKQ